MAGCSKDSEYWPESPIPDEPGVNELTDTVRQKLIMNREMEKLTDYLDCKLAECGWKIDIRNILREAQEGRDKSTVTLEELYELVRERAKMLVPRHVRRDMMVKIQQSFHVEPEEEDISDGGSIGSSV